MSKKITTIILILFLLVCGTSQVALAEDEIQKQILPTSPSYTWVKTKEFIKLNLFTWEKSSKAKVLDDFTNQRIKEMNYAESINNEEAMDLSLNRYEWQKNKELQYAQDANDDSMMDQVKKQTTQQQRELTKLQLNLDDAKDLQKNIVDVQKNVANKTKDVVKIVEGEEGAAEIDIQTKYIWIDPNSTGESASLENIINWEYEPGTEGRGEAGNVIDIQIAPGTSNGSGGDIIKTEDKTNTGGSSGSDKKIDVRPGTEGSGGSNVKIDTDQSSSGTGGDKQTKVKESN